MADGIRKRLTQSRRRVERFIHSFEAIGLDMSGDGKAFTKEAFRPAQKCEGVAVKLPVVQKLVGARGAAKSRNPQHALRILGAHPLGPTEQYDRGAEQAVAVDQAESAQQFRWITGSWIFRPSAPNRFIKRTNDLGPIEIVDRPVRDRFVFPP